MAITYSTGQSASIKKRFSEEDVKSFAQISGDTNPLHLDELFAKKTRFGKRIVHGLLVASLISSVLGTKLPGQGTIYLRQELKFLAPVYFDEEITATVEVSAFEPSRGRMILRTKCINESGKIVIDGVAEVLVPKE
ncbi:MAG: MaoC family dehydratase [Nitrososphaerota archaeon]